MPLIYITGIAGSGKSTVQKELKRRGHNSYDVDEPGIGAAHDQQGNIVKVPDVAERSPDWFDTHSWRMVDGAIEKLQAKAKTGLVFLCGATTINENTGVFDRTIRLDIDEATLRKRLAQRKENDFGQSEHELQRILDFHKAATDKYKNQDADIIDATQPLDKVIEDILRLVAPKQS
ncbi:MAG: AAA family ATPase [Candidatus Saccharibacteria bacterium]